MNSPEPMPEVGAVKKAILEFCIVARNKEEILQCIGIKATRYNHRKYIERLLEGRYLSYTIPERPRSSIQQYIISQKGTTYLKALAY